MVGVHEESVDTFLEDILLGAQSAAADEVAREEIRVKAAEIDRVAQVASGVQQCVIYVCVVCVCVCV